MQRCLNMRKEEESVGFTLAEKFFALLIILLGAILIYNTVTTPALTYPIFFVAGGLALIILGVFMFFARTR